MQMQTIETRASELSALLRDGDVPSLGLVDVGMGSRLPFEMAVRVTLADLARMSEQAIVSPGESTSRWHQLSEDLERLYQMGTQAKAR